MSTQVVDRSSTGARQGELFPLLNRFKIQVLGQPLAYLSLACLVALFYLGIGLSQNGSLGFPLDDAWIHQVYARNIGTRGEFAFIAGQPSAGSTSPLWDLVLAGGYALGINSFLWALGLGTVNLAISAVFARRIAIGLGANRFVGDWLVPVFIILEWHLTWAAVSGMEIPLFITLSLALVDTLMRSANSLWIGAIAGLLTLTRPEGAFLGGFCCLGLLLMKKQSQAGARLPPDEERNLLYQLQSFALFGVGFAILVLPYLGFNFHFSGTLLPNTFYAKSQEYAELLGRANWFVRWIQLYRQPLIGAQIALVPGLFLIAGRLVRARQVAVIVPLAWIAALPALYALRLPVDYQFGRYEMPIIPFVGIYGIIGTAELLRRVPWRVIRRAWVVTICVLTVAFALIGAGEYANSTAIINCEMVATARWTAGNLPAGALLAVHDIGAQAYFDNHPMLDLAGLVSPGVVPFIRNEPRLEEWISEGKADFAIFFPSWYPRLAQSSALVPVHSENCAVTHDAGGEDLTVYRIIR